MPNHRAWEVAIVGGGPAGLTAGLQLARAGYRAVLLERAGLGGQARWLGRIENYPGFPRGVDGGSLMSRWVRQARTWGLRTARADVRAVARTSGGFSLRLASGRVLRACAVVYCPGAGFNDLGLRGEGRFRGRGLLHAVSGSVADWRGRTVAVAGGGEAAAHQALALARQARRVHLLCRGERIKAHRLLLRRLRGEPRIALMRGVEVRGLQGGRRLQALDLSAPGGRLRLPVDALFVLVGKSAAPLPFPSRRLPPGFFVAGDASGEPFRQVVVAAGEGMKAAMRCAAFLERRA
ncbi:MAG: FAD-dependent oxidoreductase [Elusimicrobia bacterium]|nr:FAD-dependent oxidoreductase [Elusimicrobiota bacterium]